MMELVRYRTNGQLYQLTFRDTGSRLARLWAWVRRQPPQERLREFSGRGTVWHTYPDFQRCGALLEVQLTATAKRLRAREEGLRREAKASEIHL